MQSRCVVVLLALSACDRMLQLQKVTYHPDADIDAPPDATPPAEVAPDGPPRCPPDYTISYSGGTSVYRAGSTAKTWSAAADGCSKDEVAHPEITGHTHLIVLSDTAERNFLYGLTGGTDWIGLSDLKTTGTWLWVTAEPTALDPNPATLPSPVWATGEPNNIGVEHCAHFDSQHANRANNVDCTSTTQDIHEFLCECDDYPDDPSRY